MQLSLTIPVSQRILSYVQKRDLSGLTRLLEGLSVTPSWSCLNFNCETQTGSGNFYTVLHMAASKGMTDICLLLLAKHADPNIPSTCPHNILPPMLATHLAARYGHCDTLKALCEAGMSVDGPLSVPATPLHWAVFQVSSHTHTHIYIYIYYAVYIHLKWCICIALWGGNLQLHYIGLCLL